MSKNALDKINSITTRDVNLSIRIKNTLPRISTIISKYPSTYAKSGLFEGELGAALFQGYYYLFSKDKNVEEILFQQLDRSIQTINKSAQSFHLADGITGLVWALAHLERLGLLSKEDASVLDGDILQTFKRSFDLDIKDGNYDLLYGFIGKIIALRETNDPAAHEILKALATLKRDAIFDDRGCCWLDPDYRQDKMVNLGLAHGIPGILKFLLDYGESEVSEQKKWSFSVADWILSSANDSQYSRFPTGRRPDDRDPENSRLAWCYGDLGIAIVFLHLENHFPEDKWRKEIQSMLNLLKQRSVTNAGIATNKETGLIDFGFCHGSSGIAYLLNQIFILSGDTDILSAADQWLEITLNSVENFLLRYESATEAEFAKMDLGLLNGITGAGIVLLTFMQPKENGWDKIFLLN